MMCLLESQGSSFSCWLYSIPLYLHYDCSYAPFLRVILVYKPYTYANFMHPINYSWIIYQPTETYHNFSWVKSLFGGLKGPVQRSLALDLDAFEGSLQ